MPGRHFPSRLPTGRWDLACQARSRCCEGLTLTHTAQFKAVNAQQSKIFSSALGVMPAWLLLKFHFVCRSWGSPSDGAYFTCWNLTCGTKSAGLFLLPDTVARQCSDTNFLAMHAMLTLLKSIKIEKINMFLT